MTNLGGMTNLAGMTESGGNEESGRNDGIYKKKLDRIKNDLTLYFRKQEVIMNLKLYNKNPWGTTPWEKNPWGFLSELDKELDNFWSVPKEQNKSHFLACDFHEDKDHYFISMDLPGLKKEHIKINYANQILTVSGEREEERSKASKEAEHSRFSEKFYGSFKRSFRLPSSIEENKVEAQFTHGVLELILPKSHLSRGKEITVKEGKSEQTLFSKLK